MLIPGGVGIGENGGGQPGGGGGGGQQGQAQEECQEGCKPAGHSRRLQQPQQGPNFLKFLVVFGFGIHLFMERCLFFHSGTVFFLSFKFRMYVI